MKERKWQRERERERYPLDEIRVFDETESAPERVVDDSTVSLKLRSEASVHHRTTSRLLYQILQ